MRRDGRKAASGCSTRKQVSQSRVCCHCSVVRCCRRGKQRWRCGWAQVSGLRGCPAVSCSGMVLTEVFWYSAVLSLQGEAQEGRERHSAAQVHAAPEDTAPGGPAGGGTGTGGGICEMGTGLGGLWGDSCVLLGAADCAQHCRAARRALQVLCGAVLLAEGERTPRAVHCLHPLRGG